MPRVRSEYEVESIFIEKLTEMGYRYVELKTYDDVLANFREQLCRVNSKKLNEVKGEAFLSDSEFGRVMKYLENHTIYESAKLLRDQYVLELDNGRNVYLRFLTNDETLNTYQVAHQITMDPKHKNDVVYKNRYDVTILINGLPLVQIELKRPGVEINEAVNQVNRYRRFSFRGLFRYIQVFVLSNGVQTKYCANCNELGPDGNAQNILKSLVFYWTDDKNKRMNKLSAFAADFLKKFTITEILTKYFVIKETEPVLMVMRPYQIYAVKLAYDRVTGSNLNGYIFHTTGSGKTLTSYKLATLLRDNRNIDRVFFLIDRKDLDDQTVEEYNSFEAGCVDTTDSTKALVRDLQDSTKTLIITTIQKMATALRKPQYEQMILDMQKKRCVFIIDECHRSQFGKMHADVVRFFKKANPDKDIPTVLHLEKDAFGKLVEHESRLRKLILQCEGERLEPDKAFGTLSAGLKKGNRLSGGIILLARMRGLFGGGDGLDTMDSPVAQEESSVPEKCPSFCPQRSGAGRWRQSGS